MNTKLNTKRKPTPYKKSQSLKRALILIGILMTAAAAAVFAIPGVGGTYESEAYVHSSEVFATRFVPRGNPLTNMPGAPHAPGYRFLHWSETPNGIAFDFSQPMNYEKILYAIWISEADYQYGRISYGNEYDNEYNNEYNNEVYDYNDGDMDYDYYVDYDYEQYYSGNYDYAYDYQDTYYNEHNYHNRYFNIHQGFGQYRPYEYNHYLSDYSQYYDYQENMYYHDNYNQHEHNYADYNNIHSYRHNDYNYHDYGYTYNYNHTHNYTYYHADSYPYTYTYAEYDIYESYNYQHHNYGIHTQTQELIPIRFHWNHGGLWLGPRVTIDVDYRANVSVAPAMDYGLTISAEYVRIYLPMYLRNASDLGLNLPESWTYNISYQTLDESEPQPESEAESEAEYYYTYETNSHDNNTISVVTVYHDILSRPGPVGIMPLATGIPDGFTPHTLQPPFDNQSWIDAIGANTGGNRVIIVPQNVYLTGNVAIGGNRQIIITSHGTNLQGNALGTHIAPPTTFVVGHTATGANVRHFTTATNGNRLILSHIILCGGVIYPATAPTRGGITLPNTANTNLYMLQGSVIRNSRGAASGGAISAANTGAITMRGNASLMGNSAATAGGAVHLSGARTFTMHDNATITNSRSANGAGVNLASANAALIMNNNASITNNIATTSGGGVRLVNNNSFFTMNGGTISGNHANGTAITAGGGGIRVDAAVTNVNAVTINAGTISNNHAANGGGGIFAALYSALRPLPANAFPQLYIQAPVNLTGNTAGVGSFTPPTNAADATNIAVTNQRSGGYAHALNNLDINFFSLSADWFRLNQVINFTTASNIIIHPTGAGVSPGLDGANYNFVITDPSPGGNVITTISLTGGTTTHQINVARAVTIAAAPGADIVLRMPVPGGTNTPDVAPWATTMTTMARHFNVASGGNLTIGGGAGFGTLTLDGNANLLTQARGGISVPAGSTLVLQEGGIIYNNRAAQGGGVTLTGATSVFTMTGGSIANNFASSTTAAQGGGGVQITANGAHFTMGGGTITGNIANASGGGVALITNGSLFTMNGGTISNNNANGTGAAAGGGGVFIAAGALNHFAFNAGTISGNHSNNSGGGVFSSAFTYANPMLPGTHFPQLTVLSPAIFNNNTANMGSFPPPSNFATAVPNIAVTTQRSGGYPHPLNNLDINFIMPNADWARINSLVTSPLGPETIIIHPTGASGVTPGLTGTTYNLIVSDPGNGSTITTVGLTGGTSTHLINVSRQVTIAAANGANITLRMPVPNSPNTPNVAPWLTTRTTIERHFNIASGGTLTIGGGTGMGTLTLDGNANLLTQARGGISVPAGGTLVLQEGGIIYNNRAAQGGGVTLTGATSVFTMTGGSIANNFASSTTAAQGGGGVQITANGAHFTMGGGTITGNIASASGGGVALITNGSLFTMNGGTISGNNANGTGATSGGGGVFIAVGALNHFNFNAGTISGNHSNHSGGGIFTSAFTYANPMPPGTHFPQLTVLSPAIFYNNTANIGSFQPPVNFTTTIPNIAVTAQRSGGYPHPLNNLDINFIMPNADWARINSLVTNPLGPETIVIHPTGASGVTPGLTGTTYNFIISDPGDGSAITTVSLLGGISSHLINVSRPVTFAAANGANITLRMPVPGAPNTPNTAPWLTNLADLQRHFNVASGGNLTLGGGAGFGTLTLDGNANLLAQARGGISVAAGATLLLQQGAVISNNRNATGGGVTLTGATSVFNMTGGSITNNFATSATVTNGGGGVHINASGAHFTMSGGTISGNTATHSGGGVVLVANGSLFTMNGGTISGNTASGFGATAGGGGVFIAAGALSHFSFNGGTISGNHSNNSGGGVFTSDFRYLNPLPAGLNFPQLTVLSTAIFNNNTASIGSFQPPSNFATAVPNIAVTAQRSGGYPHPLNNFDINFVVPNADWARINSLISDPAGPASIVIHPTGAGVTSGLTGTTYNLIVSDPGDGSTITTVSLHGGATPHVINISRPVTIAGANGANISLRMPVPGSPNTPNIAPWLTTQTDLARHFNIVAAGNLTVGGGVGMGTLTLDGNADLTTGIRGGISVGATAALVLQQGGVIANNRNNATGGGVTLTAATSIFNMTGGSIINNSTTVATTTNGGGGVQVNASGAHFTMGGGTISGNTAAHSGGGVALVANGSLFTMNGGTISGNTASGTSAASGGGGVFIAPGADSHFTMGAGTISGNHSYNRGGGVFTSAFTYTNPLPPGAHFPQLTVMAAAIFNNNTAGIGSVQPPSNFASTVLNIAVTAQRSGGYPHPLNNYDINFFVINADWARLNSLITNPAGPENIVIHPTGASVTPGLTGTTYNLIVSDPGDGSTITTIHLLAGISPHVINVSRPVTIAAANGADITLRMPVPNGPNTPDIAPWVTNTTTLERHFAVLAGGNLTIGGGAGFGTLTLDGNASLLTQARGGISVAANASLLLQQGGVIYNNRATTGGGVTLTAATSVFNMTGGSIINNYATTTTVTNGGGGVHINGNGAHFTMSGGNISGNTALHSGGGVALTLNGSLFTMNGGTISGNTASGTGITSGGGGVFIGTGALSHFTFNGGSISGNHSENAGGGVFTSAFTYLNPLPAGAHFPQLTVLPSAIFINNTAGIGSFPPPANFASAMPNIAVTAQRSGTYPHALNNLDINFILPNADWARLNTLITNPAGPATIVIHPTGAGVTPGISGATYNFIISDPGNGSTITTVHLLGGVSTHTINVSRPVTLEAANGANITLLMPVPGAPNTPDIAPWLANVATLDRHFAVMAGGNLTIGGGVGFGTLTLDGNADLLTMSRGGVSVAASATLLLQQGGTVTNNRAANGGGVALTANGAIFNMTGGTISNNTATGTTGGGGVFIATGALSHFNFSGGSIINNHSNGQGGGIFATMSTNASPLPDTGVPHFPQLTVETGAIFGGNTALSGGVTPPTNAATHTLITTAAQRSGGFAHPLNDLDINFFVPPTGNDDWHQLNRLIQTTGIGADRPDPDRIVIHPRGTVLPGPALVGNTYHFVITDTVPDDLRDGNIIHAVFPMPTSALASSAIPIPANRVVTIEAAPGADIVLLKPNVSHNFGRHFTVAANAWITLGDPSGNSLLTLDGSSGISIPFTRGGILVNGENSRLDLHEGSAIVNNRYGHIGGGIAIGEQFTQQAAYVNMFGGLIDGNVGNYGGGGLGFSSMSLNAQFTMYGGTISNNSAGFGGAMWAMGGLVTIHDAQIYNNTAGATVGSTNALNHHGMGGAFMICCGGRVVMYDGTIGNNRARAGGGVHLSHPAGALYSYFVMRGGNITNNHATVSHIDPANILHSTREFTNPDMMLQDENGGGIFIFQGGLVIFEDPDPALNIQSSPINISNNTADRHGGGVFWSAAPIGGVVSRWISSPDVVWPEGITRGRNMPVNITNNTAQVPSIPTQSASTETESMGGGIFMTYGLIGLYGDWNISGNTADRGGGIYVRGSLVDPLTASFTHTGITIADNTANIEGGGIYLGPFSNIIMENGSIYGNSAQRGGGIHIGNPTSTLNITGGYIGQTGATGGNSALQGGGVFASNGAQLTMAQGGIAPDFTQGQIMNNTGGIFITGMYGTTPTTLNMHAGIIGGNSLLGQGNGEGVTVVNGAVFNMTDEEATVRGNVIGVSVTGVYGTNRSTFNMSGGIVGGDSGAGQGNTGGGVHIYDGALFNMTGANASVSGNSAAYGAGVILSGNSGTHRATANITAGTVGGDPTLGLGNTALNEGGGVFVDEGGFLHINGATARVEGNSANRGGGISHATGVPSASNTEILWTAGAVTHNTATTSGGGIYLHAAGTGDIVPFNWHSGTLSHNTAGTSGGGMFVGSTATLHGIAGKIISGNTANGTGSNTLNVGGGGVYVAGTFTMEPTSGGLQLINNSAPNGMGGGIFTVNHGNYPNPLPYNAAGRALHFQNLTLRPDTAFSGNTANFVASPPINTIPPHYSPMTTLLPNIGFSSVSPVWPSQGRHHPINNFDINYFPEEESIPFRLHKTGMDIYQQGNWFIGSTLNQAWLNQQLRAGAEFVLYGYTGIGTPAAGLIPSPGWVPVGTTQTSSTNPSNYMTFLLIPGVYYQLVEAQPPQGYQLPFGQWRLRAFGREFPTGSGNLELGIAYSIQGLATTPGLVNPGNTGITTVTVGSVNGINYTVTWGGLFYVGNQNTMELPMSGGLGTMAFTLGGMAVLMLGTIGGALIYVKRRRRAQIAQG